ncbi:MAG: DUF1592 domain-containing protein [Planctomycetaceae bacterium]
MLNCPVHPCHPEADQHGFAVSAASRGAVLLTLMALLSTTACEAAEDRDAVTRVIIPALQTHCGTCHGAGDEIEGDINLLKLRSTDLTGNAELVRRLIDVLDLQEMPPEDAPQPDPELRRQLIAELKVLLQSATERNHDFRHTPIRRMNRFQYNNAVTDLFDLKCIVLTLPERMMRDHDGYFKPETGRMPDVVTVGSRPLGKSQLIERRLAGVAAFPQDLRAEHGFDNQADHLSLSPLLMQAFLELGQSITQSPDFVHMNVGIWESFFATPAADTDLSIEVCRRLEPFLSKAFRRPVDPAVLERYVRFVEHQLDSGVKFTEAMKAVAAAAISSPKFFYLYDSPDTGSAADTVSDFDLASRLSFFLWGSLPDQTLLDLAAAGDLQQPEILNAQIDRMLHDRRLKRFCDSFPAQWLQLERIISSVPNPEKYPEFYFSKYRDSMHMMLEPLLLFETVLIENQPVTQLIDSDFTYRSKILEDAYGELASETVTAVSKGGGVAELEFRRVPVTDRRNGGVITNAAVMTMTSGPDRTQPITRGAWIATVIFNDPPEPPPANVPPLGDKPVLGEEHLTLRERLALHRERADCRGCHEQIDPLGFALENFNPIGVWRDTYQNGREVDTSGTLFRRHAFRDVVQFKDAILAEKDRFARALAGHLLSFALARELDASDQNALDKIVEITARDEYRMHTLLRQVMLSQPFQRTTRSSVVPSP